MSKDKWPILHCSIDANSWIQKSESLKTTNRSNQALVIHGEQEQMHTQASEEYSHSDSIPY